MNAPDLRRSSYDNLFVRSDLLVTSFCAVLDILHSF